MRNLAACAGRLASRATSNLCFWPKAADIDNQVVTAAACHDYFELQLRFAQRV